MWLAQFVSNIGGWMQTVGAQWLITEQTGSASQVALVQTASSLPVLLLGLWAGALADIVDRRRLLLTAQVIMFAASGLLAALTALGHMNANRVLLLTFVLGCGTALMSPAWQAIQPELVPRDQIPAAATLGGVNMNLARAIGPALGGLVVALVGTAAVFTINAASFLVTMAAIVAWHRRVETNPLGAERMVPALRAGYRYVYNAPRIRRILARALLFVPAAAALWALLPVAAAQQLGLGAGGYGLLLGAIGVGAVLGAVLLPRIRARWSSNVALAGGGAFAVVLALIAVVRIPWLTGVILIVAGIAWVGVLSTFNSQMQVTARGWVRARALAVYLTVFQGSMAIGAAVWGALANNVSLVGALLVAAVVLVVGSLIGWRFAVIPDSTLDRSPSLHWPTPTMMLDPESTDGPVLVTIEYRVPAARADAFVAAMGPVGRSRLRTGALHWNLYQDGARPEVYLETFLVASWEEHLRQHGGRLTASDRDAEERARSLVDPGYPFQVSHFLPASARRHE